MGDFTMTINKAEWNRLNAALQRIYEAGNGNAVRKEARNAMKVLITRGRAAWASTPHVKSTGKLGKSLSTNVKTKKAKVAGAYTGFRRGGQYDGHVAHLVDRGTKARYYASKNGKMHYTGKVKGSRFWTNTVLSLADSIVKNFMKGVYDIYNNCWR